LGVDGVADRDSFQAKRQARLGEERGGGHGEGYNRGSRSSAIVQGPDFDLGAGHRHTGVGSGAAVDGANSPLAVGIVRSGCGVAGTVLLTVEGRQDQCVDLANRSGSGRAEQVGSQQGR
jgi:hypothetical protein